MWRTYTLEHMAHVLTSTVDNVNNNALRHTQAGLLSLPAEEFNAGLAALSYF